MNAWVERHATTARRPRANSSPTALSRCVLPSPLFPTRTSGLYFFPGRSSTARAALTATWFDGPTAYAASGNAADGPGGGAAPSRTFVAACSASCSRSGSRNTLSPAAWGSSSPTSASSALRRSTSSANPAMASSTAVGASCCRSASSRCVRYPSPSHRSTASPTRARHASTAFPTVTVTSARNCPNSSPPAAAAGTGPAFSAAPFARCASSPRIRLTVSALIEVSWTAWNATSRFNAPINSRTLPSSACATVSSTPGSNRAPRSSAFRRRIATRVSYSGVAMSTTSPPDSREISRSSRSAISAGGRSLVRTIWRPAACNASVSRSSSDCISLRFVRNCTSSTRSTSTFWKRRRNASPCPAATLAWNASTYSSSVRYSMFSAGAAFLAAWPIAMRRCVLPRPGPL